MNFIKNMLSLPDLKLNKAETVLKKSTLPLLEKNQVVDAKVLKLLSPSKAELLILGKKVVADTSASSNLVNSNLAKGDTIQLKVTEQGYLSILKVLPEKVMSEIVKTSGDSIPSSVHSHQATHSKATSNFASPTTQNPTPASNLTHLSDSALQFFAKNQPLEGFTRLAATLFPNISDPKNIIPLKNTATALKDLATPEHTKKETTFITKDSISSVKKEPPILIKEPFVLTKESQAPILEKNSLLTQEDRDILSNFSKQIQTDKPVIDKADIKNLLMSVSLKSSKTDVDFLPRLLEKSGIMMEGKLADMVKFPASLSTEIYSNPASDSPKLSSSLNPSPAPPSPSSFIQEDIKGAVLNFIANSGFEASESNSLSDIHPFKEFVQNLENVQLLNSHLSESGKYIIPLPFFSGEQFGFGQLLIDLGKKKQDDDNGSSKENSLLRISIFLDMTELGPIRADFSVLKNNITGGFQVSDQDTANFFNSMLSELKERLQTHQFNVHKIECRVVELEKLAEKSIINELLKSKEHGFSVII